MIQAYLCVGRNANKSCFIFKVKLLFIVVV